MLQGAKIPAVNHFPLERALTLNRKSDGRQSTSHVISCRLRFAGTTKKTLILTCHLFPLYYTDPSSAGHEKSNDRAAYKARPVINYLPSGRSAPILNKVCDWLGKRQGL